MNKIGYLYFNMFRAILFGLVYTVLEVNVPIYLYIPDLIYRIFYFFIFAVATISLSPYLWLGNFFLSMTVEDIFYWIVKNQLPYSYAWYYPVVDHIPIDDIIEGILVIISYHMYSVRENEEKIPKVEIKYTSCGMWYYFLHGKTHDEYGMLILIVVGLILILVAHFPYNVIGLIIYTIGVGVFVDIWAHCFHH